MYVCMYVLLFRYIHECRERRNVNAAYKSGTVPVYRYVCMYVWAFTYTSSWV
jgi:hypothetical protein